MQIWRQPQDRHHVAVWRKAERIEHLWVARTRTGCALSETRCGCRRVITISKTVFEVMFSKVVVGESFRCHHGCDQRIPSQRVPTNSNLRLKDNRHKERDQRKNTAASKSCRKRIETHVLHIWCRNSCSFLNAISSQRMRILLCTWHRRKCKFYLHTSRNAGTHLLAIPIKSNDIRRVERKTLSSWPREVSFPFPFSPSDRKLVAATCISTTKLHYALASH